MGTCLNGLFFLFFRLFCNYNMVYIHMFFWSHYSIDFVIWYYSFPQLSSWIRCINYVDHCKKSTIHNLRSFFIHPLPYYHLHNEKLNIMQFCHEVFKRLFEHAISKDHFHPCIIIYKNDETFDKYLFQRTNIFEGK